MDSLKNFLIQKGYSKKDVEEATSIAAGGLPEMPPLSQQASAFQSNNTTMACVAYLFTWLTGLIIYFTAQKDDKFTRFHAMQSIFLGIAVTVIYFIFSLVFFPLIFSGLFATLIFAGMITSVLWLAIIALIIFMMVSAYKGNKTKLPIIGNLAENIVEKN